MRNLKIGDVINCYNPIGMLTLNKSYEVVNIRTDHFYEGNGHDICIIADDGTDWWFGQTDNPSETWTMWFKLLSEERDIKLKQLGI